MSVVRWQSQNEDEFNHASMRYLDDIADVAQELGISGTEFTAARRLTADHLAASASAMRRVRLESARRTSKRDEN
jgi:hypothetical protein